MGNQDIEAAFQCAAALAIWCLLLTALSAAILLT